MRCNDCVNRCENCGQTLSAENTAPKPPIAGSLNALTDMADDFQKTKPKKPKRGGE